MFQNHFVKEPSLPFTPPLSVFSSHPHLSHVSIQRVLIFVRIKNVENNWTNLRDIASGEWLITWPNVLQWCSGEIHVFIKLVSAWPVTIKQGCMNVIDQSCKFSYFSFFWSFCFTKILPRTSRGHTGRGGDSYADNLSAISHIVHWRAVLVTAAWAISFFSLKWFASFHWLFVFPQHSVIPSNTEHHN